MDDFFGKLGCFAKCCLCCFLCCSGTEVYQE